MTKKYSIGKGEDTMWKSVDVISRAVEEGMPADKKAKLMRDVFRTISVGHYNEDFANEDIKKMFYTDKDDKEHDAPYWPESAVKELYNEYREDIPDYNFWDFLVTMNMVASDNWCLVMSWFPDITDSERNEKFAEMAVNWLNDEDWPTTTKIWDYLNQWA